MNNNKAAMTNVQRLMVTKLWWCLLTWLLVPIGEL